MVSPVLVWHRARVLEALFDVVVPVFLVAAAGYVYAGRFPFPVGEITELIIQLTGACLVFDALSKAAPFSLELLKVPLTAALVVAGGVGLGYLVHRAVPSLRALHPGAAILPVTFMNAGNLGLPLVSLAFGEAGFRIAMLYFVSYGVLMYSVGLGVMAGRATAGLKVPLLPAAIAGIVVNQLQWPLPAALATPIHLLGQTVVPLMLLSLGARLRSLRSDASNTSLRWRPILVLIVARSAGGGLVAVAVNSLLANDPLVAKVSLIVAVLPPAIMNFALVERYGASEKASAVVSGAIALGTVAAVVFLPPLIGALR